jgi:hypothetical protein
MKETTSQSDWVGKVLTCSTCQRSYEVEPGDVLTRAGQYYHKRSIVKWGAHFKMPCGHNWYLPNPVLSVKEGGGA